MKKFFTYIFVACLFGGITSCDSYFDVDLEQNIPTEDAYESVQDVQNGMIGAYYGLGSYRFFGRNVIALGDMAADVAVADGSTGHFYAINTYGINDTNAEILEIWNYGYKVVDRATRTIQGAEALLNGKKDIYLSENDIKKLKSFKSQCHAIRALSTFALTNIFGLPYRAGQTNSQLGVCVLDKEPLAPFVNIKRSTVEECYTQILKDIDVAKEYYTDEFPTNSIQFYFNLAAIYALEARVNLFMGNYQEAIVLAKAAIENRRSGDVSNEMYINMWNSTAITDEDIFTIAKADDDNLSANALNTLYGSYGSDLSSTTYNLLPNTDIRLQNTIEEGLKFRGTSTSQAVSNIPILRKSEMYLTIAEAEARVGALQASKEALAYTVKRNTALVGSDGEVDLSLLPATRDELLKYIAQEKIREFFQEGHRWFDARRTGEIINIRVLNGYDVSKFVYPIPADEINAGFCTEQNEGWSSNLPR